MIGAVIAGYTVIDTVLVLLQPLIVAVTVNVVVWLVDVRFVSVPLIDVTFESLSGNPLRNPEANGLVLVQLYVTPATTGKLIVVKATPVHTF